MNKGEYHKYLRSKKWARIKVDLITIRGPKCERCGDVRKHVRYLHIHHLTYKNIGNEKPEDLEILCAPCHRNEHGITKNRKRDTPPKAKKKKNKIRFKTKVDLRWEKMRAKFGYGNY